VFVCGKNNVCACVRVCVCVCVCVYVASCMIIIGQCCFSNIFMYIYINIVQYQCVQCSQANVV